LAIKKVLAKVDNLANKEDKETGEDEEKEIKEKDKEDKKKKEEEEKEEEEEEKGKEKNKLDKRSVASSTDLDTDTVARYYPPVLEPNLVDSIAKELSKSFIKDNPEILALIDQ
ncbi:MAG: hypothetical protein Q9180_009550, partial [Flavoplaca navasiana]